MNSSMHIDEHEGSASTIALKVRAERMLRELLEIEKTRTCGQESKETYLEMHKTRFADILRLCQCQVPNRSARVLDIGRSELTAYLRNYYQNIHTLGFDPSIDDGGHRELSAMADVPHITFDLLNSPEIYDWPECGSFDLIVFSEVVEHLCVAPEFVFAALSFLLAEQGILVCTTPNAADISKRMRLMSGRNPYERLRLYSVNPGHIREYTKRELCEVAHNAGLRCRHHAYFNWIQDRGGNPIKIAIMKLLRMYPSFRSFQASILAREGANASRS